MQTKNETKVRRKHQILHHFLKKTTKKRQKCRKKQIKYTDYSKINSLPKLFIIKTKVFWLFSNSLRVIVGTAVAGQQQRSKNLQSRRGNGTPKRVAKTFLCNTKMQIYRFFKNIAKFKTNSPVSRYPQQTKLANLAESCPTNENKHSNQLQQQRTILKTKFLVKNIILQQQKKTK